MINTPKYPLNPRTVEGELHAVVAAVLSIPRDLQDVDAICIIPGFGGQAIVRHGVAFSRQFPQKPFLAAGYHESGPAEMDLSEEGLRDFFKIGQGVKIISQIVTNNTPGQMKWLAETVRENGWTSIALCVPAFHITRAFLTLLRWQKNVGHKFVIVPLPTPMPPHVPMPVTAVMTDEADEPRLGDQRDGANNETSTRLLAYMQKNPPDIATFDEFWKYIEWAYGQPILKDQVDEFLMPMGHR